MRTLLRISWGVAALALVLGLTGPMPAFAAAAPDLGVAAGYSVFGNAGITETAGQTSHLWGDVGDNGLGHVSLIASQVDGSIDAAANVLVANAIASAYGDLAGEAQTGAIDLAASPSVGSGVYNIAATSFNSPLTLNGAGVYIFRSTSSIAQTAGGTMNLTGGACASDVYWQIPTSMTFGAAGNIEGTIITNTGLISFVSGVNLKGRAWAATQVTMDNNQITEPICAAAPTPSGGSTTYTGTINVVKLVINDNGGTKTISDFPLFINGTSVVSGVTNSFSFLNNFTPYTVSETSNAQYAQTFSGDCDEDGLVYLDPADNAFCIITNNDIGAPVVVPPVPPLIDVVKIPNPLALPDGPGSVTYTYTLRNPGTVPVTNITMVGDTCSPITLASGDTNADAKLDVTETWKYTCSTTLTATHTNTVVATGWANGLSATDIASATVVVGQPLVPPLIHVTKIPSPLTLLAGGGSVTYTETITNPGTEPLSNVGIVDDKCSPMKYVSGDTDGDSKLDVAESWKYTCQTNLTATTTNTVKVSGEANGFTVRDLAVSTVVVATAVPALPKTGVAPTESTIAMYAAIGLFSAVILLYAIRKKQTK